MYGSSGARSTFQRRVLVAILISASSIVSASSSLLDDNLPGGPEYAQLDYRGTASLLPLRGTPEYYAALRKDYQFRLIESQADAVHYLAQTEIQNGGRLLTTGSGSSPKLVSPIPPPSFLYKIDIVLSPCADPTKTGGFLDGCCADANRAHCQDSDTLGPDGVVGGTDLMIGYFHSAHVPRCTGNFAADLNCGTFIEVHRKEAGGIDGGALEVLVDYEVSEDTSDGYKTGYIPTDRLCAGDYELWWVVRTRSGPYVQLTRDFEVNAPSCDN